METVKSTPNRVYKATIFAMLFEDKEHLLELYNAVSGKHSTPIQKCWRLTPWKMLFIWL